MSSLHNQASNIWVMSGQTKPGEGLGGESMFWMIPSSTKLGDDPGLITALLFPRVEGKCLWGEGCEDTALGGLLLEWFWKSDAATDASRLNS